MTSDHTGASSIPARVGRAVNGRVGVCVPPWRLLVTPCLPGKDGQSVIAAELVPDDDQARPFIRSNPVMSRALSRPRRV
jgi:hypothetical protein